MNITNITIVRVIVHEVLRASQLADRPPILNEVLVTLDTKGKDLVSKRLVDTVASGSHCVDVTVEDETPGSPFDLTTEMLDLPDDLFIANSKRLASSLSSAQTAGPIKSGSAVFVQGTCLADGTESRFIAIIKADSDQALYKNVDGEEISLTYVNDMILGESQRLIKIAFFIEDTGSTGTISDARRSPDDFSVKVFDHLMQTSGNGEAAAYFFYRTFLKCRLADNSSRRTKEFYNAARSFIDQMPVSQVDRVDFQGDLISYLRQNDEILEPRTFARSVLPEDQQDAFLGVCRGSGITGAITKDLTLLKGKLRRRSVKFSSNVTLYASPDVFKKSVKITGESDDGWTEVRIRGSIEAMP